jgi:hypothetical protein
MRLSKASLPPLIPPALLATGLTLACVAMNPTAISDFGPRVPAEVVISRSIRTDQRIDLPLDPTHADAPRPARPVAPVRIAVGDDAAPVLKALPAAVAPIEVVASGARADLVFDAAAKTLTEQGDVIATGLAVEDLPAAADRFALVRGLPGLVASGEQPVHLFPDQRAFMAGQRFNLVLGDVADRTAVVVVVSGGGTLQFLYPSRRDPAIVAGPELSFSVDVSEPFGADQIIAVTSKRDLEGLITALRRLDQRKAAGNLLGLLDALPKGDAKVGTVRIMTRR